MVNIINLTYATKNKSILSDINLEVENGSVVAILGPNGAGKSTLLNCIAGLIKTKDDTIQYYYQSINQFKPSDLALKRAFLSQKISVAFDCSVYDLVALGRYVYTGERSKHNAEIIQEVMSLTGITNLKDRKLSTLSGGELQRVHFARTITQLWGAELDCKDSGEGFLLLMDEPVNNLDPYYQHQLLEVAKSVCEKLKATLITVLHDLNLASQYADSIILMSNGKVINYGLTQEVLTESNLEDLYKIPVSTVEINNNIFIHFGEKAKELKKLNIQIDESPYI